MKTITRFPPSPTGYLHIGRARTALFNYLFAQKNHGKMVFRIEDTDPERSKREYEDDIIECLKWLGIHYDSGPFRQSERNDIYKRYLGRLVTEDKAYISRESSERNPSEMIEVVRFRNPNKIIKFTDLIRGEIEFDTTDLKDFVIARSLDEPLYHMAVVVDDYEMGITHIIRGDDGISNTPRQLLIQEAIGAPRPEYAHIPLILAPDRSKMSGRHGAVSVTDYRNKGYLPEALINFLAFLGWNPGTEQEIFGMKELIEAFDLDKVQKSGAVFNVDKLNWFNREYITRLSEEEFKARSVSFMPDWLLKEPSLLARLVPILRDKITVLSDISTLLSTGGELAFVKELPNYPPDALLWKKNPSKEIASIHLNKSRELMTGLTKEKFTAKDVRSALWAYAEEKGRGDVLWPLRVALTGQDKSPDPFVSASILGKETSIERIDNAIKKINK